MPRKFALPDSEKAIGKRLRLYRERLRLSRLAFAAETGTDTEAISRVEHGRSPLLCKLAWQLNRRWPVSPHWLVTGEGTETHAMTLPAMESIGARPLDHFSKIYQKNLQTTLLPAIQAADERELNEPPFSRTFDPSPRGRLRAEMILGIIVEGWVARVADAHLSEFVASIEKHGDRLLDEWGDQDDVDGDRAVRRGEEIAKLRDDWMARGILVDMPGDVLPWQLEKAARKKSSEAPAAQGDNQEKGLTSEPLKDTTSPVQPIMPTLIERLRSATKEHGRKTELAKWLGVPRQSVNGWLAGDKEPSGETTLRLLHWVEQEERKPKQKSPGSGATPPEQKTRSTQNENQTGPQA